jgi:hypothetical protein
MTMTRQQCRAARGWLCWTQDELALRSGYGGKLIHKYESGHPLAPDQLATVIAVFRDAGIEFRGERGIDYTGSLDDGEMSYGQKLVTA